MNLPVNLKAMPHEGDNDTNYNWYRWNSPQELEKVNGRVENRGMRGDHPNYSVVEIGLNTEMSPGDVEIDSDSCKKTTS